MRNRRAASEEAADPDDVARLIALFKSVEPNESVWSGIEAAIAANDRPRRIRTRLVLATLAAAAGFVVGVSTAVVADLAIEPGESTAAISSSQESATVRLVDPVTGSAVASIALDAHGYAVFTSTDLPSLDAGHTYQLWAVVDDAIVSAGLLGPTPSETVLRLEADPSILAVTVEKAGGVVVSEQEPVAVWSAQA